MLPTQRDASCAGRLLHDIGSHAWLMAWFLFARNLVNEWGPRITKELTSDGLSTQQIDFIFIGLVPMAVYFVFGCLLAFVDLRLGQSWMLTRRVQPAVPPPTSSAYLDVVRQACINWAFIGLPYTAFMAWYAMPWRSSLGLPSLPLAVQAALCLLLEELAFFSSHRLFHTPALYASIHKQHHRFTEPFGMAAIYAHPLEHLLSNVIPVSLGPLVGGMSSHAACAWSVLAVVNTMISHSGWKLPGMHNPSQHDWHHEYFNENYGVLGLCDWLAGTDVRYRAAIREGVFDLPRRPKAGTDVQGVQSKQAAREKAGRAAESKND